MTSKELRIGNIVNDPDGFQLTVTELGENVLGSEDSLHREDQVSGIPLTDDWLMRAGFEKCEPAFENCINPYWAKNAVVLFFTETPPENTFLLATGFTHDGKYYASTTRWITSVHELQNYYFACKGEELTFKE